MGSVQSNRISQEAIFRQYKQSIDRVRHRHCKAEGLLVNWKKFLLKKLDEAPYCNTPNWEIFRKPIEKWINKLFFEDNCSWLANARFLGLIAADTAALLRNRNKKQSTVIDLDKLIGNKALASDSDISTMLSNQDKSIVSEATSHLKKHSLPHFDISSSSKNSSCLVSTRENSIFCMVENSSNQLNVSSDFLSLQKSISYLMSSNQVENKHNISSTEELKKFLRKELAFPEHPVNGLIQLFRSTYESNVVKRKIFTDRCLLNKQQEVKAIDETLIPIKMMLHLLREFISLIYKDLITVYADDLNDEDQSADAIIDQLICQLMFDDVHSLIYQHVIKCLQMKCREQIYSFNRIVERFQGKCLHQFDNQFKEKYLPNSSVPYETVIKTLQRLQLIPNPYMKKDYITMLEQEMICAIKAELAKKGHCDEIQLESDDKFTIYTYCLIQSNYPNVVVDLSFIEEFTLPEETNQAYARFKGCLIDYILSQDFLEFMKIEEEMTLKALQRESNRKCCKKTK